MLGIRLALPDQQDEKKPHVLLVFHEQKYLVQMGDAPAGNARRVIHALKSFQKFSDKDKEHLDSIIARKIDLQKMVHTPDPSYVEKLASCETEVEELRRLITLREQGDLNAASL